MGGEPEQWLGPGEMARRLGVTPKALKVYEREALVAPHRTSSGWRLYGPTQVARLHQIIVLRALGMPLKSIGKLLASQSRLREVLVLQLANLKSQQAKIGQAIDLIGAAQRQLDQGRDLSLGDLATLTRETVVQPRFLQEFDDRLTELIAQSDPTGAASHAFEKWRDVARSTDRDEMKLLMEEHRAIRAEARRLSAIGDINSDAAKELVRRWRCSLAKMPRPGQRTIGPAANKAIAKAARKAIAEARAKSANLPDLWTPDRVATKFIEEVTKGMKARGELDCAP
jgi:DNA-binding transcriptional MerR regulator